MRSKQTHSKAEDGSEHSVSLPARGLLLLEAVLAQQCLCEGMGLAVRLFYSPCHAKSRKVLSKTWCVGEATGVGAFVASVPPGLVFPQSFWKLPGCCALWARDAQPDSDGLIKTLAQGWAGGLWLVQFADSQFVKHQKNPRSECSMGVRGRPGSCWALQCSGRAGGAC